MKKLVWGWLILLLIAGGVYAAWRLAPRGGGERAAARETATVGRIVVAVDAPNAELQTSRIDVAAAGAVLVVGARVDIEALSRARAIGVAAVVLLTSIGEGVNRFVLAEFSQFGTNIVAITPGKTSTFGMSGAVINTVRPLSMEDAQAMQRIRNVEYVVPVLQGNAEIEHAGKSRRSMVIGAGHAVPQVWQMDVKVGRFLPDDDPRFARALAVLGSKMALELFGSENPLGKRVRIAGERYRVIGVMESKGVMLGFDLDDTVFIPAGRALAMFNRESLMEVDLLYKPGTDVDEALFEGGLRNAD
mgnify:CR=1 FL=1